MSNNDDEFEDDINLDESFDDFEQKNQTLGDLWRENPLVKIGAIVGGVILIFMVIMFLGGDGVETQDSLIGASPTLKTAPATEQASQAFIDAIEESNEAAVEEAFREGTSALPVPIEPPIGVISVPEEDLDEEDPLQRWRRLQEERLQREIQQRDTISPADTVDDVDPNEAIEELAGIMAQQMSTILEVKDGVPVQTRNFTDPDFLEKLAEEREEEEEIAEAALDDELEEDSTDEILLPAGKIVYAQLLTEANTDVPGPVLAQLLTGPLKGNRIIGSFEAQNDFLTLNFETVIINDESLGIDAIALDPDTTLPGLATEVDHRYFQRVILPAAAAFVEGMAEAIAESGRTTVTISGETVAEEEEETTDEQEVATGIREVGEELREILDEMADEVEVLIRIEAGTPIGVLFLEPVTSGEDADLADIDFDDEE